jgi:hypothetical protein
MFWVGLVKSTISNNGLLFLHGNGTSDAVLQKVPGASDIGWYTNNVATSVPVVYNSPVIFSCTMQEGTNMLIQKTDLSGTVTNNSIQTSSITAGSAANLNIAGTGSGLQIMNSHIGEIIYYHTLLTVPQRQLIEGYLAWKWKLNEYLPESSPYSSVNPNSSSNVPPICFLKGSIVETDQGMVEIQNLNTEIHSIGGKKILALTKTPGDTMSLVLIKRNLISRGSPNVDTPITVAHKILQNNVMTPAIFIPGAVPYKYTNDFLYNVLLETHETMKVNGMIVETLSPLHPTAKIYLSNLKKF